MKEAVIALAVFLILSFFILRWMSNVKEHSRKLDALARKADTKHKKNLHQ